MHENGNGPSRPDPLRRRPRRLSPERRRLYLRRRLTAAAIAAFLIIFGIVAIASAVRHHHRHRGETSSGKAGGSGEAGTAARQRQREGAAIDNALSYTAFYERGLPRKREVALTFDDGPGPYTPEILAVLRRTKTPATFFVVGSALTYFSDSLRVEQRQGFAIGSHTQDHLAMGHLGEPEQESQLRSQADPVAAAGGPHERLFRPPYGSYNSSTLQLLKQRGMLMVLWSLDTNDYERPGVEKIVKAALAGAKPGAVILMHDAGGDRSQTVAALPKIIRGLRRRGLRPVTIPRLILDNPPPRHQALPDGLGGS